MEKEAAIAQTLLKAIKSPATKLTAAGLAAAGAGYGGHRVGFNRGVNRATDQMAVAFSEANTRENQQIVDSFKLFNKKENRVISNQSLRRGMALGAELHATGKIKTPAEMAAMAKTSEDAYNAAFEAELEKDAFIGTAIKSGLKTLKGSFRNLGSGVKAMKDVAGMKGVPGGRGAKLRRIGYEAKLTAGKSKAALGTIGGGAAAAYAMS